MKRFLALGLWLACSLAARSQQSFYAAARAGLSLREQPNTSSAVLEKIAYGEKIAGVAGDNNPPAISTEGFNGYWWKVTYKGKTGFVVSSYTLPIAPPKAGTKTMADYFAQLSAANGSPLVVKNSNAALSEMGESTLTKQLYKNGMEWHRWEGYESNSELYLLPELSIEQCYLLIRLIGQYPELITDKDPFPVKNSTQKKENGSKSIEVQREVFDGRTGPINKIKIGAEQGAIYELEIYLLQSQAVIFYSSGV
jgi:hypothetical protein